MLKEGGKKIKKIILIFVMIILVVSGLGTFTVSSEEFDQEKTTLLFSKLSIDEKDEYITLELKGTDSQLLKKDHYIVPTKIETFTFPFGTEIINVKCTPKNIHEEKLSKELKIAPEPILASQTTLNKKTQKSENPISVDTWYDYSIGCGLSRNQRSIIIKVQVFPVQYHPLENSIEWAENFEIKINFKEPGLTMTSFNDEYEFIVLTPSEFTDELNSLINHKNGRDISTKLVTLDEIYDGSYFTVQGRDDAEKIKYFIKNAYENWNTRYVLLVGGINEFPVRWTHVYVDYNEGDDEVFVSDLYFADIYDENGFSSWDTNENDVFGEYNWSELQLTDDVDLYPDVYLGRLACTSGYEVTTCVNKIITYETNEACATNWFNDIVVIGGDTAPEDYEDINEGEYVNQAILDIMDGFIPDKIWDSNKRLSGFFPSGVVNINNGINSGCGFVDFSGHGSHSVWTTYPHNGKKQSLPTPTGLYTTSHISNLNNGDKLPIVIAGACSTSKFFENPNCFSWSFLSNPNGGGIAAFGPAALSWGYDTSYVIMDLGGKMHMELFKAFKEHDALTFGEMWTIAISNYISTQIEMDSGDYKTAEAWQPFGDPTLAIAKESRPPVTPDPPNGAISGRVGTEYTYTALTTEPDGDQISYLFDWGDDTYSGWTELKDSGQAVTANHTWTEGDDFNVRVMAKDEHGQQSEWSDFVSVSMPKNKWFQFPILEWILEQFPILQRILEQLF